MVDKINTHLEFFTDSFRIQSSILIAIDTFSNEKLNEFGCADLECSNNLVKFDIKLIKCHPLYEQVFVLGGLDGYVC